MRYPTQVACRTSNKQQSRDSNSINIHNDSNKSSAVKITENDKDINNDSVKDIDKKKMKL